MCDVLRIQGGNTRICTYVIGNNLSHRISRLIKPIGYGENSFHYTQESLSHAHVHSDETMRISRVTRGQVYH